MEKLNASITQHLESFVESARELEMALQTEQKKNQKISQEYVSVRSTLEEGVRELKRRLVARDEKIQAITSAYTALQKKTEALQVKLNEITARESHAATELIQLKNAFGEAQARESEAQNVKAELEKAKRTLIEQRNQILTLEAAHSSANRAHQVENANTVAENQRLSGQVAQLAQSESRLRNESVQKESQLRASLKKEVGAEKARIQELARNHVNSEIERVSTLVRKSSDVKILEVNQEMKILQNKFEDMERSRHHEMERARARLLALTEESHQKSVQADALKGDIQLLQRELNQTKMTIETVRKDSSKAVLMEHLRTEAVVHELQAKIDHLMNEGVYAEKTASLPPGMPVFDANPVNYGSKLSGLGTPRETRDAAFRGHFS